MAITSLDHLVLTVHDIPATCAFYTAVLGMTEINFGQGRKALQFGRQKINLHELGREIEPHARAPVPGSADLCFLTDLSASQWMEHLGARGINVELGPVVRTGAMGGIISIYVRDPDGNLVELACTAGSSAERLTIGP